MMVCSAKGSEKCTSKFNYVLKIYTRGNNVFYLDNNKK
jgi:hypothetical protein